jgi:hypothetical protein
MPDRRKSGSPVGNDGNEFIDPRSLEGRADVLTRWKEHDLAALVHDCSGAHTKRIAPRLTLPHQSES